MFDVFEYYYSMGLAGAALIMLRLIMTPLLIYNAHWSFNGFRLLLKGVAFPTSLYQTTVFMFSLGVLGYNALTFLGRTVSTWSIPWSLSFQCMFLLAALSALIGRKVADTLNFEKFYWLFSSNNLDIAVRAAEMNAADPEFTQEAIAVAETTLAVRLAKKAINGNAD